MKRKTIIITGILILTLLAVTGYFLYPYYVKQKTISEKTAEINTIEKDFKNSTDRESRLELLKSTIQESKDYTKSKKFFPEISDQYKTLISSMQNKFVKEYQQIMEENAPLDIGTSDDIDTLANHKDNLNNLLTTIEAEKEYTLSNNSNYQEYIENLSSYIEAYTNRITDIEEKQKTEAEAQKKAEEEAKRKAEEEEARKKAEEETAKTHYENEYFSIDVPKEWIGNWSVSETENTIQPDNPRVIAAYSTSYHPNGDGYGGGAIIHVLKLEEGDRLGYGYFSMSQDVDCITPNASTENFVFIMTQAGAGFFNDGGATITAK